MWKLSLLLCIIYFSSLLGLIAKKNNPLEKNILPGKKILQNDDFDFDAITSFLQTTTESSLSQSYDLYIQRITKLRKKKEIIIKKVYEKSPLVGEILAISNVEKINLIVNKFFIIRETELLKKFIIMWDANNIYDTHSAKVLLNLLLCNNKFNRLRCMLNLLLEGLCMGDDRSIKIFKEIIVTVIIDTLLKTKFYYFNDLQAKFNLIRIFNKGFNFRPVTKIQFVEKMLLSDKMKELLTFIIMNLKSREDIEIQMDKSLHTIPPIFANNTKLFEFQPSKENAVSNLSQEDKISNMDKEMDKQMSHLTNGNNGNNLNKLSRVTAQEILNNIKSLTSYSPDSFKFKEKLLFENEEKENFKYSETEFLEADILDISSPQKIKLNEIKEKIKNEYNDLLFNQTFEAMPDLEEPLPNYQIGISNRTIYPKYKRHLYNLIHLNELLDEYPPNMPKGSVDVSTPRIAREQLTTSVTKQVAPGVSVSMQFKEKSKEDKMMRFKSKMENKNSVNNKAQMTTSTISQKDFADKSMALLQDSNEDLDLGNPGDNYNNDDKEKLNPPTNYNDNTSQQNLNPSMNYNEKLNPSENYNDNSPQNKDFLKPSTNYNNDNQKLLDEIKNNSENNHAMQSLLNSSNKNVKVMYPKEIHSTYQINKKGTKVVEVNANSNIIKFNVFIFRSNKKINFGQIIIR
jgi:hypothetical protein